MNPLGLFLMRILLRAGRDVFADVLEKCGDGGAGVARVLIQKAVLRPSRVAHPAQLPTRGDHQIVERLTAE
jgi:hypothetical protein